MPSAIDLTGQTFGCLVVEEQAPNIGRDRAWRCRCRCGSVVVVRTAHLRRGLVVSCGCYKRQRSAEVHRRHGHSIGYEHSLTYTSWRAMLERCRSEKHVHYERYRGRGIGVCERWLMFENFLRDMGERPSKEHSIDRIDNDRGYEPANCRWATRVEQARDKKGRPFGSKAAPTERSCQDC